MIVVLAAPLAGSGGRVVAVRKGDALARNVALFGTDEAAAIPDRHISWFFDFRVRHGGSFLR
jgi:hypothetical protein